MSSLPRSEEAFRGSDRLTRDATERRLQVISEVEFDVMKTLYKDLGGRVVGDEGSLLDALEGRLGKRVVGQVKRRRALRNKLVHGYLDVDPAEVYSLARNLGDLEEFEREVSKLLKVPEEDSGE